VSARTLIRADAVFEAALGLTLVVGAATGGVGFPQPVGRVVIGLAGALLLALALVLWRVRIALKGLAAGNLATAGAAVVWLATANGFPTAGAALLGAGVAGLVALAGAELALGRTPQSSAS
jgi:hypothetical protein